MPLAPGTRLGPYEIVAPLGSGGMGDVYRARDPRLEREVAVKVLPERLVEDPAALNNFEREAKAVAALSHPNILAIHDYGREGTHVFSVTELLDGETLRSRVAQGALPWRKAVEIGSAIADGLAAAHSRGIIHRDLKPENVIITSDGRVKILDFGIAQLKREEPDASDDPSTMPTAKMEVDTAGIVGTAGYMSPEQLKGERADERSDIFAFGALLYELVAGKPAFVRNTVVESLSAVLTDTPDAYADTDGAIPLDLSRVIQRCLEKNRDERFQSARDLSFALRAIGTSPLSATPMPIRRTRKTWLTIGLAGGLVAAIALAFIFTRVTGKPPVLAVSGRIDSLAILPFENATTEGAAEYLADGITESLINSLSHVSDLRVMSRTSVFHYKGQTPDPRKIGRELKVDAVLVGRITRAGERFVVSVELVNARDNSHVWGDRYEASRGEMLGVQARIAEEISATIRTAGTSRVTKRYTENAEAYDLYLRGRYEWNRRSAEGLYKAIDYFNEAIARDPRYALAYAGLADCWNLLDIWAGLPTRETFPKAKEAATRALELDDSLAEAHTSLAYALHSYDRNWTAAEREYRRAIELKPNYATAYQWYSEFLTAQGRFDEASVQVEKALSLDPLSPIIHAVSAWNSTMARRYPLAVDQGRRAVELFPTFMPAHAYLGLALLEGGRPAEAIPPLQRARELADIVVVHTWQIRAWAEAGERQRADAETKVLSEKGKTQYLPPYYMAALHGRMGRLDAGFAELERALSDNSGALVWLRVDPALDPLREDARFASVLAKAGF